MSKRFLVSGSINSDEEPIGFVIIVFANTKEEAEKITKGVVSEKADDVMIDDILDLEVNEKDDPVIYEAYFY